jgi:hypothetical protein
MMGVFHGVENFFHGVEKIVACFPRHGKLFPRRGSSGFFTTEDAGQQSRNRILRSDQRKSRKGRKRNANADPNSRILAQRRRGAEKLSMGDAAGRKRISTVWKFKISYSSDSDLDPFLAKNAKGAKELGRYSRRFHLRPSATSAVEDPELPRHGKCLIESAQ